MHRHVTASFAASSSHAVVVDDDESKWSCPTCTFNNVLGAATCEVCSAKNTSSTKNQYELDRELAKRMAEKQKNEVSCVSCCVWCR